VYRLGEDNGLVLATVGFGADSKDVAETMMRAVNVCYAPFELGMIKLIENRTSNSTTT